MRAGDNPRLRTTRATGARALCLLAIFAATNAAAQQWQAAVRAGDYDGARAGLEEALLAAPNDTSLRYELARVLALAGLVDDALAQFDALLADHPDNADYLLGRAQMLARLGRDDAAIETTEEALRLAPDYEDVLALNWRLVERRGDPAATAALRQNLAARFPNAPWLDRPPAPIEYARWISIEWGGDRLSNTASDWRRRAVRVDWQTDAGGSVYAHTSNAERFDRTDTAVGVGGAWQALPQWRLGAGLAATGDADFEPTRELALEAQRSWPAGFGTELRYRHRDYPGTAVTTYSYTGDKYLADYRLAYRLDYSRLLGGTASMGHSLTFGWYPNERRSLGVTAGAGEEIEIVGLDQLLRTRVASVTLTGRESLSPRVALSWWLGTHRQGDFYRRQYGGLSVRVGL